MEKLIFKAGRFMAGAGLLLALTACGGGGDGDAADTAAPPAPPAVATTVNLQSALIDYQHRQYSYQVSGSGTIGGLSGNAEGTIQQGPPGLVGFAFEDKVSVRAQATDLTLTLSNNSGSTTATARTWNYFDTADLQTPLGSSSDGVMYAVTSAKQALPTSAKAGDKGLWYAVSVYDSSDKKVSYGTTRISYELKADSADTLLLILTSDTPESTNGEVTTRTLRVSNNGTGSQATPLEQSTRGPSVSYTLTYR